MTVDAAPHSSLECRSRSPQTRLMLNHKWTEDQIVGRESETSFSGQKHRFKLAEDMQESGGREFRAPTQNDRRTESERFYLWQGRRSRPSEDGRWSLTPSRGKISRSNADSFCLGALGSRPTGPEAVPQRAQVSNSKTVTVKNVNRKKDRSKPDRILREAPI